MLALILVMLFCVAVGAGVVVFVMAEARREGRGEFWTPEGEELIAGARRTTERVRARGGRLGRTAAVRTRDLASRLPERGAHASAASEVERPPQRQGTDGDPDGTPYRAAS